MAKRLFEDIQSYAVACAPSPAVKYVRVANGPALLACLADARILATNEDVIPLLHIECHGSEDGLELADGSFLEWAELKTPITTLNIATRLNLMVAVAACIGGAFAKMTTMSDRAPFWGLIGPTKTLYASDLDKAFRALYLTLLSTKSPAKAIEAMNQASEPGLFWRATSQGLFEKAWNGYKNKFCTPTMLEKRAKRMRKRARALSQKPAPTIAQMKRRLIEHEPAAFELYRKTFFMSDLYPEHNSRFPILYVP